MKANTAKHLTLVALMWGLSASAVWAQTAMKASERREDRQERRIEQGVAKGQLTPTEARKLQRQQARIDQAQDSARADGVVTQAERRQVHRMQDRASRNIQRQKHDAQKP